MCIREKKTNAKEMLYSKLKDKRKQNKFVSKVV